MYSIREMEEMHPGSTIDRPGTYGPFNTVVECYLDRVARSLTDFDIIETAFRERGVSTWCLHETISSLTHLDKFRRKIEIAEEFSTLLSNRIKRGRNVNGLRSRADLQRMVGVPKNMCVSYNSNYRKQISPAILGIRQMCHMS
jgi:hypothetical protein